MGSDAATATARARALVGSAIAAALALALPAGAGAGIISHERPAGTKAGLGKAAIARALPRAVPTAPEGAANPTPAGGGAGGASGSISGRPPAAGPDAGASAAAGVSGFGRFESRRVIDPTAYPNSANGRLFGRIGGLGAYSCSASVVRARNKSVIFTAGHCVKDPGRGGWAKRLTFVPAYSDGAMPFGRWDWKVILTPKQWGKLGNSNFDYAAVVLKRNRGSRVADATGSLGLVWGSRRNRTYRAVGYPANHARGEAMWECISSYLGSDPLRRRPGPRAIGIGCDMLSGASGGGWTIFGDRLASLSSFGFVGRPNELYGPRFTKRAERMRRRAQRE